MFGRSLAAFACLLWLFLWVSVLPWHAKVRRILRVPHRDNPPAHRCLKKQRSPSPSVTCRNNNLVMFDQSQAHESMETIVP